MVYRVYVEKKNRFAFEANSFCEDIRTVLGIEALKKVRILNRYDCEDVSEDVFEKALNTVFSEPQVDTVSFNPDLDGGTAFGVEYLPGQFDQRADSAAQCIQIISRKDRPEIRTAKIYVLYGDLSDEEIAAIKKYIINPVESREASFEKPDTLKKEYYIPTEVEIVRGFIGMTDDSADELRRKLGLAMDRDDIIFCREYFKSERRDPTITEIRMIDTYWSDHCRHTTFNTTIDGIEFDDEEAQKAYKLYLEARKEIASHKPICLMDMGTIAAKVLKRQGKLQKLDESEEINACTVKITVNINGKPEKWLLLFKNETHNHPTEIEPFGGAATCIGGAIRDPLSGRSYVYSAMRVTGAADPTVPISETIEGKLPQRKLTVSAAAGYSSYGNQIGLATSLVDEVYHPGYAAKRMEIGAVIAAAPEKNVIRKRPVPGDIIVLLGGRTGRDGCGGATGSSKAHDHLSLETCGAEVQKGNAPEERKLQRLFRNPEASKMIKRCNDFGAGGVSVAIGELADGIKVDLNAVPRKYDGLDGTELAISESQERMAVVLDPADAERFMELANMENLEATAVAEVTEIPRLVMTWNGSNIVNVSREFLDSNGAPKHVKVKCSKPADCENESMPGSFSEIMKKTVSDLNICSKRGLSERFDSTIGAGTVLAPFGGKNQRTPIQAMVNKISTEHGDTDTVSIMSWAFDPYLSEKSPYRGAYTAVLHSVAKLIAAGAEYKDIYLTFQEYFEKPGRDPLRWGKPTAAVLGAFAAQIDLGVAAIGGKDSMSGSYEDLDVPPTLVSFAVTVSDLDRIVSPEFKSEGSYVYLIEPLQNNNGIPDALSFKSVCSFISVLTENKMVRAVYAVGAGGISEAIYKMCIGNGYGFDFDAGLSLSKICRPGYGSFIIETAEEISGSCVRFLGRVTEEKTLRFSGESVNFDSLNSLYEARLESVFTCNRVDPARDVKEFNYESKKRPSPAIKCLKPKVLIPIFPGTNCEYDSVKAIEKAGADAITFVINNRSASGIEASVNMISKLIGYSQAVMIPGGFSGGDEPDGSGKFITSFFRNDAVNYAVAELLEKRDGLMLGICNGFQALIKLGLVPYGRITEPDERAPTLTYNTILRHQSKIVHTRIASNKSPWLSRTKPGEVYCVPISHGEGNFVASRETVASLASNGQIATQYADPDGKVSGDIDFNPNGSIASIEGITSPDGRVFGKMGHSERVGKGLYINVPGNYDMQIFESMVDYYKI